MTESKSFNRASTIILTVLVIVAMLPILLIVVASFSSETSLFGMDIPSGLRVGVWMPIIIW